METAVIQTQAEACAPRAKEMKKPAGDMAKLFDFFFQLEYGGVVWRTTVGIAMMHVFALYGIFKIPEMKFYTMVWTAAVLFCTSMGITVGAHRLWTHRGYKAHPVLRFVLMIFQTAAMQNSMYIWVRDHRVHHKYTDTDADPHNINRGFFFAHVGWLMVRKHPEVTLKGSKVDMSDLKSDPMVMFQYKFYYPLMVLVGIAIPVLVPVYFWGEDIFLAAYAILMKHVLQLNATWLVNSGAHTWGYKPYDKSIAPTESLTVNLFAGGEGFHNYHHCFPFDYFCEEMRLSPINVWGNCINFFARIGLAYDLRTASKEMIKARMERTGDGTEIEHEY